MEKSKMIAILDGATMSTKRLTAVKYRALDYLASNADSVVDINQWITPEGSKVSWDSVLSLFADVLIKQIEKNGVNGVADFDSDMHRLGLAE